MKLTRFQLALQLVLTICCQFAYSSTSKCSNVAASCEDLIPSRGYSGYGNESGTSNFLNLLQTAQAPTTLQKLPFSNLLHQVPTESRVAGPGSNFEAKHVFNNGDSFATLTQSSVTARRILVEMNRKLPGDDILPKLRNNETRDREKWFHRAATIKIWLIDTAIKTLADDIRPQYEEWKSDPEVFDKTSGEFMVPTPVFKTSSVYQVTELSYIIVLKDEDPAVEVWAEELETELLIATYTDGRLKQTKSAITYSEVRDKRKVTTFTYKELELNANIVGKFWRNIGVVPEKSQGNALNDQNLSYLLNIQENDEELMKKVIEPSRSVDDACNLSMKPRSNGKGCGIIFQENGDVETVHPKELLEEYKRVDNKGKTHLTDLAKNNINKVPQDEVNTEEKAKLDKLIQLEDVKSHAAAVDAITKVHSGNEVSSHNLEFVDSVEALEKQLSDVNTKVKPSSSKVAQSISNLANYRAVKGFSEGIGAVSKPLATYFLVKSLVNGIINKDKTSLGIAGAQIGFKIVTSTAAMGVMKVVKLGQAASILGAVAGPIGAVADIGLGVWTLTKSVERLKNANNKYDRNDAIADIVSTSVDIAVTATVTTVSIAFPPIAPFMAILGAVIEILNKLITAIFKAANHVAKINAEIPLLESEKREVFKSRFFDWFGTRKKDYVDYLLEEMRANDIAVQHNLKFLQENPSFRGVVFPSRTLKYEGSCHRTSQYCAMKNAWGCTRWEQKFTSGTGCDWNKPCSKPHEICTNSIKNQGTWGYNEVKCICQGGYKEQFGVPRRNSWVDFRNMQKLYWERAVPKDVEGADFKCKPGNTTFADYKLHQENQRTDYLCQNAIALLQPMSKRHANQTMFFNLEDGNDTVFANYNDLTPNLFFLGEEGIKQFYGGLGRNEFVFNGKCTSSLGGVLAGGRSDKDAVSFLSSCAKGSIISFENGMLSTPNKKLLMQLYNIEELNGREMEQDLATVNCYLRSVALLGGKDNMRRDVVTIPHLTYCAINVTVFMGNYTTVESKVKRGNVSIIADKRWNYATANLHVHPEKDFKLNVIFLSTASHQVAVKSLMSQSENISSVTVTKMLLSDPVKSEITLNLNFTLYPKPYPYQPIYFKEDSTPLYSALLLTPSSGPVFYHRLSFSMYTYPKRFGNPGVENIFQVEGPNWSAIGGEKADVFLLNTTRIILVDGREGEDTLRLDPSLKTSMTIDLAAKKTFKNIENVDGAPGNPLKVICACDTKFVNTLGGSANAADTVIVPSGLCKQRELQIVAKGTISLKLEAELNITQENSIIIVAVASNPDDLTTTPIQFELETMSASTSGLHVAVQLPDKNWTALAGKEGRPGTPIEINMKGGGNQRADFKFRKPANYTDPLLTSPHVQISMVDSDEPAGQLVYELETRTPKIYYRLEKNTEKANLSQTVEGMLKIPNVFLVHSGSWQMTGGSLDDVIVIHSSALGERMIVDGGTRGENTLVLETNPVFNKTGTYVVNLETGELGLLTTTTKGVVKNIHNVLGRIGEADVIHATCTTKAISGRGGVGKGDEDLVFVSGKNCSEKSQKIEIYVEKFTNVRNAAVHGSFTYHISDPMTTELELTTSANNMHLIDFAFNPWEKIQNIAFDKKQSILGIKFGQGDAERVQLIKMYREEISTEFSSPVIEFHQPGTQVTSDIRVSKDGVVAATVMIHEGGLEPNETVVGLPVNVNHFIVNVTKYGFLRGGGKLVGSSSSGANQFWIFELKESLDLLDGGNCDNGKDSCTNYLQFADSFQYPNQLEIRLDEEKGNVRVNGWDVVSNLKNIHELRGRNYEELYGKDKVTVSSCKIRQLSEIEEIIIKPSNDCAFNLVMEVGDRTAVVFEDSSKFVAENSTAWLNSTFHYKFKSPRNFTLGATIDGAWVGVGATHNYYLPLKVDNLELLRFDSEIEELQYSVYGKVYNISMIGGINFGEQFYAQPVMTTEDGFKINVGRDGSIILSLGAGSSFPKDRVRSEVIPTFEAKAKKLGITIMMQTDTQFIFVGHGNGKPDRNILQNLGYSDSYLVGGGANDTIYEIVDLQKDVFIYTGFDYDKQVEIDYENNLNLTKQTIDLTDIVVPIRVESGTKYVPKLEKSGTDLVISMNGYEGKFPGKVWIINGQQKQVASRIQLLLSNAIMDLVPETENINPQYNGKEQKINSLEVVKQTGESEWKISPRPIIVPEGIIYSISKEDFEDGHEIRVETTTISGNSGNSTFQVIKNGGDLYLTNMRGENDVEATTVMITDYLRVKNKNGTNKQIGSLETLPSQVFEVTVSVPGLELLLNDSKLIKRGESNNNEVGVINPSKLSEWKHLLHETEEIILEDMPDIERTFPLDESQGSGSSNSSYYGLYIGLACGLLAFIAVALLLVGVVVKFNSKLYNVQLSKLKLWNRK